jgi:hypothetical protein
MSLQSSAEKVAPVYGGGIDLSRPEEQLIEAFQKARQVLFAALPKDAQLDFAEAKLAADLVAQQVRAQQPTIVRSLDNRQDLPIENAVTLDANKSRQYYVGKYFAATQGLGGYPAGLGREAVEAGAMTHAQYIEGMDIRLRAFSEIIHAGDTGQLVDLVNGEKRGGNIVVTTKGDGVIANAGGVGLGIEPGTVILLALIATAIVAGVAYSVVQMDKNELTIAMMTRNCGEAMRQGNERAIKHCNDFAREAASGGAVPSLIGDKGREQLLRYLGYAGAAYLAILVLPSVTSSILSAQQVAREQKQT